MAVDHRQAAVVVFLRHEAARILAEGAHLVFVGQGIADELALVEHVVHRFHDFVAHFHAHADVDRARFVRDAVFAAELVEPAGTAPPAGDDRVVGAHFDGLPALHEDGPLAGVALDDKLPAGGRKPQVDARIDQITLDAGVNFLSAFGAQMADGTIDQLQARFNRPAADLGHRVFIAHPLDMGVGPELQIEAVDAVDRTLHQVGPYQVGQVAAHLMRKRQLAVGKGARPRKARRDAAGVAVHAAARFGLGAMTPLDWQPAVDEDDMARVALFEQR